MEDTLHPDELNETVTVFRNVDGKIVQEKVPETSFFFNYWHGGYPIPPVDKASISYTNIADKRKPR